MIQKTFLYLATVSILALAACAGDSAPVPPVVSSAPGTMSGSGPMPASQPAPMGVIAPMNAPGAAATPNSADLLGAPVSTTPKPADVESRLSHLESDVAMMKGQIQLVRPILEKMPALQDKLTELVAELQRIDARVSSVKSEDGKTASPDTEIEVRKAPASGPDSGPAKAAPAPLPKPSSKMSPIISPAPKPATHPKEARKPEGAAKRPASAEMPAPKADAMPPAQQPASAPPGMGKGLTDVRVGDDPEKTRVVLDVSDDTHFQYDLDNTEKILIVDLDTPVTAAKMATLDKSPIVASYATQSISPDKSRVILQLRTPVQVLKTSSLPPNDDKGYRVILDLAPAPH